MRQYESRLQEFCEFYGWPEDHVRKLFRCSVAFFECVWRGLDPQTEEEAEAYYAGPWLTLRQMSYQPKFCPNAKVKRVIDEMKPGEKFLDWGCGVGDSLIYAEGLGIKAMGVEVAGKCDFLRFRRDKRGQRWNIEPVNNTAIIPYRTMFDRAVICGSLDHCPNPVSVARILCSVTKGHILATPRIDESYDRPTHTKEILEQLPEAFNLIDEHNANL